MAVIRKYGDHPQVFVPDVGEVVMARRAPVEKFIKAAVIKCRRIRSGKIKVTVQWLEDDPVTGVKYPSPIKAGSEGRVIFEPGHMGMMIRQIDGPPVTSPDTEPAPPDC